MEKYDLVVIGSGSGKIIVNQAINQGLKTALIDKGPVGGTCLNLGCIPSKMLIYPADRVQEIKEAKKLGVDAEINKIKFNRIMERMRTTVNEDSSNIEHSLKHAPFLDFYKTKAYFVNSKTLEVAGKKIQGDKIIIAAGARPHIPSIQGVKEVDYLTNESVLELKKKPKSLIIIGGGYIAAEYAHFFEAMGTKVTIIQRNRYLVPDEEPEISQLLKDKYSQRMSVHTEMEAVQVEKTNGRIKVVTQNTANDQKKEFEAEKIMIAAGRESNADLLKAAEVGIETDEQGYIRVDDYFQTSQDGIWAFGDIIGRQMFKHAANREAAYVWHNAMHGHDKQKFNYQQVPHAVFSYPQIASVGLTEKEALKQSKRVLVGKSKYWETAKGEAMLEKDAFAKAIVENDSYKILGFHVIGPYAPILIQEVINVMKMDGTAQSINKALHIHPALPEVVSRAFYQLQPSRLSKS